MNQSSPPGRGSPSKEWIGQEGYAREIEKDAKRSEFWAMISLLFAILMVGVIITLTIYLKPSVVTTIKTKSLEQSMTPLVPGLILYFSVFRALFFFLKHFEKKLGQAERTRAELRAFRKETYRASSGGVSNSNEEKEKSGKLSAKPETEAKVKKEEDNGKTNDIKSLIEIMTLFLKNKL